MTHFDVVSAYGMRFRSWLTFCPQDTQLLLHRGSQTLPLPRNCCCASITKQPAILVWGCFCVFCGTDVYVGPSANIILNIVAMSWNQVVISLTLFFFQNYFSYSSSFIFPSPNFRIILSMFTKSSSAFYRNTSIGGTRTFLLCWVFTSMNMVHLSIYLSLLRFISSASYNLPSIDPAYILSFDIFLTISIVVCFLWIYMYCYDSHFL